MSPQITSKPVSDPLTGPIQPNATFLLQLSDTLREFIDPIQMQRAAMKLLAHQLQVMRASYYEVAANQDDFNQTASFETASIPLPKRMKLSDYGDQIAARYRAGETLVFNNTDTDPRVESQHAAYQLIGVRAWVGVPLVKQGQLLVILGVHSDRPREWTDQEVQLVEAVADRTWHAVERARAEEALSASEKRVTHLFDMMPAAVYSCDAQGRLTSYNQRAVELWGCEPRLGEAEQLYCGSFQLWNLDGTPLPHTLTPMAEAVRNGQRFRNVEVIMEQPSGQRIVASVNIDPLYDSDNRIIGAINVFVDITDRKKAEDALRQSEEYFRLLVTASSDSLYRMSADWSQMLNLKGMSFLTDTEQANTHWLAGYIPLDEQPTVQLAINQAILTKQPFELEHRVIRGDGSVGWTYSRAIPLLDEQGEIREWFGAAIDITDRKRAEAALQEADRRKDEFLAMLAHELRNPMATIRSGLQILSITDGKDETSSAIIAMMNRQSNQLVHLVDDLLDVSRISRGKIELQTERLDLVELVQHIAASHQASFQEQSKSLHLNLPPTAIELKGDATRLSQAVTNLVSNGLRYTGEHGQVWLSLEHQGQEAILTVRDNGIGLSTDQLLSIFEMFVQVDNSTARAKGGLGLGLTLVKRLVELHGGQVAARSEGLGKGSTFVVHLPTLTTAAPPSSQSKLAETDSARADRILIIDDNADAAFTLTMLLKLSGYDAYSRTSGRAGIEAAEHLQPSTIVLDLGMPELDGYATCRLIREQAWGQHMVIIALTGYGQSEDKQRTQEAGFDGHLTKPVDMATLVNLLTDIRKKE